MHITAIITLCFSATLSAGFLLAGFAALLSQDDVDHRRFEQKVSEARRFGSWKVYRTMRRESLPISQIAAHWRTRSEVRRLIWIGLAFSIATFIAAQFI